MKKYLNGIKATKMIRSNMHESIFKMRFLIKISTFNFSLNVNCIFYKWGKFYVEVIDAKSPTEFLFSELMKRLIANWK